MNKKRLFPLIYLAIVFFIYMPVLGLPLLVGASLLDGDFSLGWRYFGMFLPMAYFCVLLDLWLAKDYGDRGPLPSLGRQAKNLLEGLAFRLALPLCLFLLSFAGAPFLLTLAVVLAWISGLAAFGFSGGAK